MLNNLIITLVLTIVMPGSQPNMEAYASAKTLEECAEMGAAFVTQDPKEFGAMGLAYACVVSRKGDNT